MPPDIDGDIDIVARIDTGGMGPADAIPAHCSAATVRAVQQAARTASKPLPREVVEALLYVLSGVLLGLPLLLLFLPGNRSPRAAWILAPHGLYVALAVVAGLEWRPERGPLSDLQWTPEAMVTFASVGFLLSTLLLGAWFLEGRSRMLAFLSVWLIPPLMFGIVVLVSGGRAKGDEWLLALSVSLVPPIALALQALWLRRRFRWWVYLPAFALATALAMAVVVPVVELVTYFEWRVVSVESLVRALRGLGEEVTIIPLIGTAVVMLALAPYMALCFANRFYRRRLFAIYRRPGMAPPEGFGDWREFEQAHRKVPRRWVARGVVAALVVAVAILYGSPVSEQIGKTGRFYPNRSERPEPQRIGPDTPLDAQRPDIAMPDFPDEITSTTFPTHAVVSVPGGGREADSSLPVLNP